MTAKPPGSPKKVSTPNHTENSALRPGGKPARAELEVLARQAAEKILRDPAKAARLLTEWLQRPAGAKKSTPAKPTSPRVKKSA